LLEARKGVNAPGTDLAISSITDKDREDLAFICEMELDYVALSFVRAAADILELRKLMKEHGPIFPSLPKLKRVKPLSIWKRFGM
jgi:pyruvate kinase